MSVSQRPRPAYSSMEEFLEALIRRSVDESFDAGIDKLRQMIIESGPTNSPTAPTNGLERTYSTAESAAHLQLTEPTVAGYCRTGEIRAERIGRKWVVTHSALEEFKARRRRGPKQSMEQPNEAADRVLRRLQRRS